MQLCLWWDDREIALCCQCHEQIRLSGTFNVLVSIRLRLYSTGLCKVIGVKLVHGEYFMVMFEKF